MRAVRIWQRPNRVVSQAVNRRDDAPADAYGRFGGDPVSLFAAGTAKRNRAKVRVRAVVAQPVRF